MSRRLIKSDWSHAKHIKSSHLSSVSQTERRASLQSTLFDTSAPSKASVLGCSLKQQWHNSTWKVLSWNKSICWQIKTEECLQEGRAACVGVQTYFAHVFSMMEGFERRWLTCFFSLGQTCKADKAIIITQASCVPVRFGHVGIIVPAFVHLVVNFRFRSEVFTFFFLLIFNLIHIYLPCTLQETHAYGTTH